MAYIIYDMTKDNWIYYTFMCDNNIIYSTIILQSTDSCSCGLRCIILQRELQGLDDEQAQLVGTV